MAYELAPLPGPVSIPRYDYSGFAQAGSDIADIFVERRKQAATNSAIQQLMGAQSDDEKKSAIARLIEVNPTAGAALGRLYQPMTPYETASLGREDFAAKVRAVPKEELERWTQYPETAPDWYKRGLQGDFGTGQATAPTTAAPAGSQPPQATQPTPQPTPQPAPQAARPPSPEEYRHQKLVADAKAKQEAAMEAKKPSFADSRYQYQLTTSTLDDAVTTTDYLLNLPDTVGQTAFGLGARIAPSIGNIADARAAMNTLKGQIGLGRFQALRETSKTGSTGMQRLTNMELGVLQNSLASLDPNQDWEQIKRNLRSIKQRMLNTKREAGDKLLADYPGQKPEDIGIKDTGAEDLPKSGVDMSTQGVTQAPPGSGNIQKVRSDEATRINKMLDAMDAAGEGATATDKDPNSPTYGDQIVKRGKSWWDTKTGKRWVPPKRVNP